MSKVDGDNHAITVSINDKRPAWGPEWVFAPAERAENGLPLVTLPVVRDANIRREFVIKAITVRTLIDDAEQRRKRKTS